MKALVLSALGTVNINDVPIPHYAANEILIRTKAATICTSDLIDMRYNPFNIPLPLIMGHEGAGIVVAVGDDVTDIHVGDEVAAHPVMPCYTCTSCKRGLQHLCDNMEHLGFNRGGVFAEYFVSRPDCVRKKPASMSFAKASLMEPVCVCLEALRRGNLQQDSRVLIIGDGPFGVMTAKLAYSYKPKQVILSGRHDYRLQYAAPAETVNEQQTPDIVDAIMRLTEGEGIDSAILCVSSPQAMDTAVEVLRTRGTVCVFSSISGKTPVDLFKLHVKELTITGACNDENFMDEAMLLLQNPTLNLGNIITHEMPFDQWEKAFHQAENGKDSVLKVSMLF